MLYPDLLTTLPVVIPLLGAIAALLLDRFTSGKYAKALSLSTTGGAIIALLYLRGHLPLTATISDWLPAAFFGRKLIYHIDDLSFLFSLLLTFVGLAVFIAPSGESTTSLAVLAAGLSFVLSADLITLCFSWVLLDFTLLRVFIAAKKGFGKELCSLVASYLLVFALVSVALLLAEEGQSLSLSNMLLKPRALYLLLLATFVRARLYPLPIGDEDGQASSVLSHLIPTGAGLYLLARFYTLFYEDSTILAILGGLSFFIGAFLAFCEHDPRKALHYFLVNQAGYAFLSTASRDDVIFTSINLFLCFGIFCLESKKARGSSKAYMALMRFASAIGQKYRIQPKAFLEAIFRFPWSRAFSGIAIASVAGAPITLGFIGLASFYRSLFVQGNWFLLAMVLLTEVFLLASLFRRLASLPDALPRFCAGSALLCIPILLLGIHPPLLAIIAHVQAEFATLAAILRSMSIAPWLALLLPLIGGYVFHKLSEAFIERFKRLARLLRLDWLYISLGRIALGLSNIMRAAGELIEGEGYLGWITIFIIIVFLIL